MLKKIYSKFIFKYPFIVFLALSVFVSVLAFYATKVEIDASAETLLLEDDKDLVYFKEINKRYNSNNFLIVSFSPNDYLLSENSLETIRNISKDFESLKQIKNVDSILTVPILSSSDLNLTDLLTSIDSMSTKKFENHVLENEFLTSPLYSNNLVSSDFKTTALSLNIKEDEKFIELTNRKDFLAKKQKDRTISMDERKELNNLILEIKIYRDFLREDNDNLIKEIRQIIDEYKNNGKIFLGGVNMIASDAVSFVKKDLLIYGLSLIAIFIFILWFIFRKLRWILLPLGICFISIVSSCGILGFFKWEITVISSNFVALQLIITMSIVIHLIERYRELYFKYKNASQYKLVMNTVLSKSMPCFLAIITTVIGFVSLILSNMEPIINLGLMMSVGIILSLVISFIIFPIILLIIGKKEECNNKKERNSSFINKCSYIVENHGKLIILTSCLILIFGIYGMSKVFVENSFINYFKKSTEIYKGMIVIDEKLGGTTPLDIIIKFNNNNKSLEDKDDFDFEDEYIQKNNDEQYWFSQDKIQTVLKVHDYLESIPEVGKVQSLATLLKIGKKLNDNKDLDAIALGLFYNKFPEEYKKLILSPYLDIKENEVRISTRIIDSNPNLRRNDLINKIQNDLNKTIVSKEATYHLTNLMILYNNMLQSLFESQILTAGFSILILALIFFLIFKNIKVVFISLATNLIPVSLVFGIMGWFKIPLDMMTITIAAIALGIAVDATIHFIHRFKIEYNHDHNYINAIKRSHIAIGHAIYYTTLIIVIGFSILMLSNLVPTIYFGILTSIVMISVLISNLLLLPKLLIIFKPYKEKGKI